MYTGAIVFTYFYFPETENVYKSTRIVIKSYRCNIVNIILY